MTRTALQRVLPAVLSVGILVWLLADIDLAALARSVTWRVTWVMAVGLLLYGASTLWLEVLSIAVPLEDDDVEVSRRTVARIKCASYLLSILNYALGIAGLSLLLHRRLDLPLGRAASAVLLVSSADLIVVLLMAGMGTALIRAGPQLHAGVLLLGLLALFGGLVLLRMPGSLGPLDRIRQLSIFEGLRTVAPRRLAQVVALRVAFASCFVSVCACAFYAFDVRPPLIELVSGVLIVALVGAIPIVIAGLGTTQAAFLYLFSDYASQEKLLAMSLVLSAGMLVLRAGMGVVFAREFTREALASARSAPT